MHKAAWILLIIGGLNWGIAVFNGAGLEGWILEGSVIWTIVYALVGLSAIYGLFMHKKMCEECMAKKNSMGGGAPSAPQGGM